MSEDKEKDKDYFSVQFRITKEQAQTMHRLADILFKNGIIKVNSINALLKACAFTQVNLYLQYEAKELAYQERERQLELDRIELEKQGIVKRGVIPNLGGY